MSECVWRVDSSYVTYAYLRGGLRFLASPAMHACEITFIFVERMARPVQVQVVHKGTATLLCYQTRFQRSQPCTTRDLPLPNALQTSTKLY